MTNSSPRSALSTRVVRTDVGVPAGHKKLVLVYSKPANTLPPPPEPVLISPVHDSPEHTPVHVAPASEEYAGLTPEDMMVRKLELDAAGSDQQLEQQQQQQVLGLAAPATTADGGGSADGSPGQSHELELMAAHSKSPGELTPVRSLGERSINVGFENETPRSVRLISPRPNHELEEKQFDERHVADVMQAENYERFTSPAAEQGGGVCEDGNQSGTTQLQQPPPAQPSSPQVVLRLTRNRAGGDGPSGGASRPSYRDAPDHEIDAEFADDDDADSDGEQEAGQQVQPELQPGLEPEAEADVPASEQRARRERKQVDRFQVSPAPVALRKTRLQLGDEVQVLYLTDMEWYDAVISSRRKADGAYGVYFPASGDWKEWAEWVSAEDAETRLRKRGGGPKAARQPPAAEGNSKHKRGGGRRGTPTLELVGSKAIAKHVPLKMRHKKLRLMVAVAAKDAKSSGAASPKTPTVLAAGGGGLPGPKAPKSQKGGSSPAAMHKSPRGSTGGQAAAVGSVKRKVGRPKGSTNANRMKAQAAATAASPKPGNSPKPSPKAPVISAVAAAAAAAAEPVEVPAAHKAIIADLLAMGYDTAQATDAADATAYSSTMAAVDFLSGDARRRKRTRI
eukprot:SAG22_NODE_367_length_11613_cov_11.955011_8_plen_623_part_00